MKRILASVGVVACGRVDLLILQPTVQVDSVSLILVSIN
jgi:hypothetical protein